MKKFLLLIFCAVLSIATHAEKVTEQEAIQKAQQFLQGKKIKQVDGASRRLRRVPKTNVTSDAYYVFNVEDNGGFVIVSGDDRTEEILGYADKGNLDMDNLPDNMKMWLGVYEQEINSIAGRDMKRTPRRTVAHDAIAPLLTCQWGQGTPYNAQCPVYDDEHCVTGCVPTALAQLMYFHRWPESVGAIEGYESFPELPATTFNWDQMNNTYNDNDDASDVAKLMRYCGQATKALYSSFGTIVYDDWEWEKVLSTIFGYDKSLQTLGRNDFLEYSWHELLYEELHEGRPILYGGYTPDYSGHSFIVDGYKDGLFHINWGWEGFCDTYFLITVLDPFGSNNPMNGYTVFQKATIGIRPSMGSGTGSEPGTTFQDPKNIFTFQILNDNQVWLTAVSYAYESNPHWDENSYLVDGNFTIPSTVTYNNHEYHVVKIGDWSNCFWDLYSDGGYEVYNLILPESLEKITHIDVHGPNALTIPKNVMMLGADAINSVTIENFNVVDVNPYFKSIDGVIYTKDGETIVRRPPASKMTSLVIPDGVKHIAKKSVFGSDYLQSLVLPESVEGEIEEGALGDLHALESLVIPDGITSIREMGVARNWVMRAVILPKKLRYIYAHAFYNCPLLEELTIPGTVEFIGDHAFYVDLDQGAIDQGYQQYSSLSKITVKAYIPITILHESAFSDYTYQNATLYVPQGTKAKYEAAFGWGNFANIVEVEMPDVDGAVNTIMESVETSFCDEVDSQTDLTSKTLGNTYYTLTSSNGDGYNREEKAIVLNSTTTADNMETVVTAKAGDEDVSGNFNGIIFRVPAGGGTITVDAKTIGSHLLNVQIGDAAPIQVTKSERGTVVVPYRVTSSTYVYLYASSSAAFAPVMKRAPKRANIAENSLLLYGYKLSINYLIGDVDYVLGDANGDGKVNITDAVGIVNYLLGNPSDGFIEAAADVNNDGSITITDAVSVVNMILENGGSVRELMPLLNYEMIPE